MGMTLFHTEVTELQKYLSNLPHRDFCPLSQEPLSREPSTCTCGLSKARLTLEVGTCGLCGGATALREECTQKICRSLNRG